MSTEVQVFINAEFGEIRTVRINGEPFAVGKDIAKALGYKDHKDALQKHVDSEDKIVVQKSVMENFGISAGRRGMLLVNESGIYSLALSSKLPGAKKFKQWLTSEVLPAIRKTGEYSLKENFDREFEKAEMLTKLAEITDNKGLRDVLVSKAASIIIGEEIVISNL